MNKLNKDIVLIADRVENHSNKDITNKTFEMIEDDYFNKLFDGLNSIANNVIHYEKVTEFLENIKKHKNDIVVSPWSGIDSRNRKALVPSICEAYNICYLGADAYTQVLCQDKALTKSLCKKIGLDTPNHILIENYNDIDLLHNINLPLVVKPNFEGGSIGISNKNLVYNYENAKEITLELLNIFKQPIIVEEFIHGDEVSIILLGNQKEIIFSEVIKLELENIDTNLKDIIFSYEIKKQKEIKLNIELIDDKFQKDWLDKAKLVFQYLDKIEYTRIDGRIFNNKFYCLEIAPDASINKSSIYYRTFNKLGYTYEEMLYTMLSNTMKYCSNQSANMQ